jgi:hypothetical protein
MKYLKNRKKKGSSQSRERSREASQGSGKRESIGRKSWEHPKFKNKSKKFVEEKEDLMELDDLDFE